MRLDPENKRIYIRQSWLGDNLLCPQRSKYAITMPTLRRGSDATAIGTALHESIERNLNGFTSSKEDMVSEARAFVELELAKDIKKTDISRDEGKMYRCVDSMASAWYDDIRPYVPPVGETEFKFKVSLDVNASNGYEIWLEGTMDYMANDGSIWDWKTASRSYFAREKQTQSHQATCYVTAARKLGLVAPDAIVPFRFGVMVRQEKPKAQIITTTRGPEQDEWLSRQIKSVVDTSLNNWSSADWTMNDQNFLCSSKWCDYWHLCKGNHWQEGSMDPPPQEMEMVTTSTEHQSDSVLPTTNNQHESETTK